MNKTTVQPKRATARTTTIQIIPPSDMTLLKTQYQLVRYLLPDAFVFSKEKDDKFPRLHNELKEQLDAPYKVYTHDNMDNTKRWAVYVLYPRTSQEAKANSYQQLQVDKATLPSRIVDFDDPKLELHILVKLLQIAYFRREDNSNKHRFVGQDKCFVYAKRRSDKSDKYHICLEIELKGDRDNIHVFSVYGRARTFARDDTVDPKYAKRNIYYSLMDIRDDLVMFSQVKRSQVSKTRPLYVQRTFEGSRTTLDYHSSRDDEVEQSRGYLVDTFIRGFAQYLSHFGFEVEHVARSFTKFKEGAASTFKLPINLLGKVYVYDVRFKKQHPLSTYIEPFQAAFPGLEFEAIEQVLPDCDVPVLFIEDCQARAFEEGMPLHGQTVDPHRQFYEEMPEVAKQFINVNDNDLYDGIGLDEYLDYEVVIPDGTQILVMMNQLFLKDLLVRRRDITKRLPFVTDNLIFIHRENRKRGKHKQEYEVALYFENNVAHILDLRAEEDCEKFYRMAEHFGVDVEYDNLRKQHNKEDEDRNSYDAIIGSGLCVEIVDANESLLYEYEEIIRRIESATLPLELDELKLAHRYDDLVAEETLTKEWLLMRGLIQIPPMDKPKSRKEAEALELYQGLHRYDQYLDQLKNRHDAISFRELTTHDELEAPIAELFKSIRKLHNLYKKVGMFGGIREAEVIPVYQGIWYSDDSRYVIGDTNAMDDTQARAHRVRQFVTYRGAIDLDQMLDTMSVQFVRLNQYTVRPFYFHLIDIYIDNVLHYRRRSLANNTPDS
jgi:hypothetical protein